MMDKFTPDMYQKSIYTINYEKLIDDGIRCLLFDLDNTCVPYVEKVAYFARKYYMVMLTVLALIVVAEFYYFGFVFHINNFLFHNLNSISFPPYNSSNSLHKKS